MSVKDSIYKAILETYNPAKLEIVDESYKHAGHAGSHPEGESHFLIEVSAAAFDGMTRVAREKALRKTIDAAAPREIHAIRFRFV